MYVYICVARYATDFVNTWVFKSIESAMKHYRTIYNNHIAYGDTITYTSCDAGAFVSGEYPVLRFRTDANFECFLRKEKVAD